MKPKDIICLNNGDRYFILNRIDLDENKNYIFAIKIDEDNKIANQDGIFFQIIKNRFETKISKITSKDKVFKKLILFELIEDSIGNVTGAKKQINDLKLQIESSI